MGVKNAQVTKAIRGLIRNLTFRESHRPVLLSVIEMRTRFRENLLTEKEKLEIVQLNVTLKENIKAARLKRKAIRSARVRALPSTSGPQ